MHITGLKSLSIQTLLHFRPKLSLFCPFNLLHFKPTTPFFSPSSPRHSLFCSLNGNGVAELSKEGTLPLGVGEKVNEASRSRVLQVVLVSPQIPGNTGSIARTCAASNVGLHLVGPLGFKIDDTKLKRAGLDYWPYVVVKVHDSWEAFRDYFRQQEDEKRLLAFTKRGTKVHSPNCLPGYAALHLGPYQNLFHFSNLNRNGEDPFSILHGEFSYRKGDYLLFGSETSGLPPETLIDCKTEPFGGGTIKIPIVETYVRCLNQSVSVGIALYEASRQLDYEQLQIPSESCINTEE